MTAIYSLQFYVCYTYYITCQQHKHSAATFHKVKTTKFKSSLMTSLSSTWHAIQFINSTVVSENVGSVQSIIICILHVDQRASQWDHTFESRSHGQKLYLFFPVPSASGGGWCLHTGVPLHQLPLSSVWVLLSHTDVRSHFKVGGLVNQAK